MTETSCVISCMDEGDNLSGHVGSPNPACGEFEFCYLGSISGNKLSCALDNGYISYIRSSSPLIQYYNKNRGTNSGFSSGLIPLLFVSFFQK